MVLYCKLWLLTDIFALIYSTLTAIKCQEVYLMVKIKHFKIIYFDLLLVWKVLLSNSDLLKWSHSFPAIWTLQFVENVTQMVFSFKIPYWQTYLLSFILLRMLLMSKRCIKWGKKHFKIIFVSKLDKLI